MRKLIIAVALLASFNSHANALYDANLSYKEVALTNAINDLADEFEDISGKKFSPEKRLIKTEAAKKSFNKYAREGIRAKKSCLKIKSDLMDEQKKADSGNKIKDTTYTSLIGYKAYLEAMGDYAAAYCMTKKHP